MRSDSSFPLDAEQIVRLTGAVLTRVLNAIRSPDAKELRQDEVTLALGQSAGVPLRVSGDAYHQRLLPYEASVRTAPTAASAQPAPGGADAA